MQCGAAVQLVLPQAKIIQGLFLLIFSFLPRSGILAIQQRKSAEHNYGSASEGATHIQGLDNEAMLN